MATRCFVSIPPSLRGDAFAGAGSSALQHRLIRSWKDAGLQPVSINTAFELARHPDHQDNLRAAGVDVLVVPSSGGDYPAYLPNLQKAVQLAADRYPGEVLAITNADIHIRLDESSHDRLASLPHDGFLIAHRTDVQDDAWFDVPIVERRLNALHAPFLPGIDFIAARAETMQKASAYLSPDLTIGLPWWDLLLPMALFSVGATRSFLASDQFLHLKHEERWDPRWLDQVGTQATRYLHRSIKAYKAPAQAFLWTTAYAQLVSPLQTPTVYKSRLLNTLDILRQRRRCPAYLLEVLRMTEALVCEQGWDLDQRWIESWY